MHIISFSTSIAKTGMKDCRTMRLKTKNISFVRLFSRVASRRTSRSSSTVTTLAGFHFFSMRLRPTTNEVTGVKSREDTHLEGSLKVTFRIWRIISKGLSTNLINSYCWPKHRKLFFFYPDFFFLRYKNGICTKNTRFIYSSSIFFLLLFYCFFKKKTKLTPCYWTSFPLQVGLNKVDFLHTTSYIYYTRNLKV